MDWTTTQPTQEGTYNATADSVVHRVQVKRYGDALWAVDRSGRLCSLNSFSAWLGPLPIESQLGNKPPDPRHAQPL